jgi:tRNA(fMet)-specific endonuclease VapC
LGELYAGAHHVDDPAPQLEKIADLLTDVRVLDFDNTCAKRLGEVRGSLLRRGISMSTADLMIGSVALVHDLTLVTNNIADFKEIPGLRLADWLAQ